MGFIGSAGAATFGTVVPIRGHVSDIALDPGRGVLYAANFTANRIEVVSTANLSLQSPILVANQPSTLALSADGRFLVVGHYTNPVAP
jgi:DNA-binding beta-propeller fold protein YncE